MPGKVLRGTRYIRTADHKALAKWIMEELPFLDYDDAADWYRLMIPALDREGLALLGCNEHLVVTRPDLIREMHGEYFAAGVDAVETATFGSFGLVLAEYGIADRAYELSEAAARIARTVADDYSTPDRPRYVIGSVGPGTKLPTLGAIDFGLIVDGAVVMMENFIRRRSEATPSPHAADPHAARLDLFTSAATEVARPILFGVLIIVAVYLPIFTLEEIGRAHV